MKSLPKHLVNFEIKKQIDNIKGQPRDYEDHNHSFEKTLCSVQSKPGRERWQTVELLLNRKMSKRNYDGRQKKLQATNDETEPKSAIGNVWPPLHTVTARELC